MAIRFSAAFCCRRLLPRCLLFLTFIPHEGVRASVRDYQIRGRGLHVLIAMGVDGVALRVEVPGLSMLGKGGLLHAAVVP